MVRMRSRVQPPTVAPKNPLKIERIFCCFMLYRSCCGLPQPYRNLIQKCAKLTLNIPRKPGAKAVVVYKAKILLVLRDNIPTIPHPNTWNTPGGGIDGDETPEEAMVRELEEEVHLTPSSVINLGTTRYTDGGLVHRFYVPVTDQEFPLIRLGNEGQKLGWFTLDELLQLNVSPHSFVYYTTHEQDIRSILLEGKIPPLRHDLLGIE